MAIDIAKSQEIREFGTSFTDDDGNVLFYLTSGTGDPTGSPSPVNTWYFQEDQQKIWRKNGSGDNDWEEFVAKVAQSVEADSYADNALESTTSTGFVTKFEGTTNLKEAGDYLILNSSQVTNSNNNRNVGYRFQWKASSSSVYNTAIEIQKEIARGESFEVYTAASRISILASDTIDFRFQYGQVTSGGTARMKENTATFFKVVTP